MWGDWTGLCHCVGDVRIRSYSGPYFPTFGLSAGARGVPLRIQSGVGGMRAGIAPNTYTFYVVFSRGTSYIYFLVIIT